MAVAFSEEGDLKASKTDDKKKKKIKDSHCLQDERISDKATSLIYGLFFSREILNIPQTYQKKRDWHKELDGSIIHLLLAVAD